ncbi:Trypsin-like serine proteases, typically periplasmic, contain C-terminal PDZ domain [Olavius algarvensis associated proteobacterium Delta 3]|nr:Trypsin-like serine proteases, typically periplasmic, contain C-terminal PDZ domain [Olavius algarvensis associated proteobacterium Delta 3]CAB5106017.1 Trypsin-like serine proteases, typically periplasmic, contain C-terminal PDZ domain [Olavius algarvensis associated proteobacterium Delta 3]
MNVQTRTNVKSRRYGVTEMSMVAVLFLIIGLMVASGLNMTGTSMAEEYAPDVQAPTLTSPVMPGSFAELSAKLSPTVVNVKVTKVEKAWFNHPQMPEGPFGEFFERYFNNRRQQPENRRSLGAGSGVIIDANGTILTNNHVVEGAKDVTVTLADKKEYKATVVGRDPKTDLAVLKIESDQPLPSAAMGDSENLKVGDWVVAIGNPFGLSHTVTSGIVSAKGRVIGAGPYDDFIQTDASINPGNSGGPLFNMNGEIVGINTAIIPYGQGIGFAIPVNTAKPLIPQMVSTGKVTRSYLGVNIQTITPDLAKALKLEEASGALVADVTSGSPADKAGVRRGDVIMTYDKITVTDSHDLPAMVAATPVGEKVTLTVVRNGKEKRLTVKTGRLPSEENELEASAAPAKAKWGLQLQELTPQLAQQLRLKADKGLVVVGVSPDSPAADAGLRQGDVILEVNRKPVDSVDGAKKQIRASDDEDSMLLLVQRGEGKFFVPLEQG